MRFKLTFPAILALTAAILMPYTAAAAEISGSIDVTAARVAAEHQLRGLGINPSDAVFQEGLRNYAGADCPGGDWNCTTASVVVQIGLGASAAKNVFECSAPASTSPTCTVVQFPGADNEATCVIRGDDPVQTCNITQTNVSFENRARVYMVHESSGPSSTQLAFVKQSNGLGGANRLQLTQEIKLDLSERSTGVVEQLQNGDQVACVEQTTTSADNTVDVRQGMSLKADANTEGVSPITQFQNAGGSLVLACATPTTGTFAFGNGKARIAQATTETGRNRSHLNQTIDLDAHARTDTGGVTQHQGSGGGGLFGDVDQMGGMSPQSTAHQREDQKVKAHTDGVVFQSQTGPEFCCSTQTGLGGTVHITQSSAQTSDGGFQTTEITGQCATAEGQCTIHSQAKTDAGTDRDSFSGEAGGTFVVCASGGESGDACPPPIITID